MSLATEELLVILMENGQDIIKFINKDYLLEVSVMDISKKKLYRLVKLVKETRQASKDPSIRHNLKIKKQVLEELLKNEVGGMMKKQEYQLKRARGESDE